MCPKWGTKTMCLKCPKMGHKWGTKWGTKEGAEVNLLVKDGDTGFLYTPNGVQKLCASSASK